MVAQRQTATRDIPHRLPSRLALALAAVVLVFGLGACSTSPESGAEGREGSERGADDEESGARYERDETYDMVRSGARLILRYDAASETFRGTVTNETDTTLARVRVEVHLIGDTELGRKRCECTTWILQLDAGSKFQGSSSWRRDCG